MGVVEEERPVEFIRHLFVGAGAREKIFGGFVSFSGFDDPARISNKFSVGIVKRNGDTSAEISSGTMAQSKVSDRFRGELLTPQIFMLGIKAFEFEIKRRIRDGAFLRWRSFGFGRFSCFG